MCDPGPSLLVVVAKAITSRLGRSVFKSKPPMAASCEPLVRSVLRMLAVLFTFIGPKGCHEDEDCWWETILVLKERSFEVQDVKTTSGIDDYLG